MKESKRKTQPHRKKKQDDQSEKRKALRDSKKDRAQPGPYSAEMAKGGGAIITTKGKREEGLFAKPLLTQMREPCLCPGRGEKV